MFSTALTGLVLLLFLLAHPPTLPLYKTPTIVVRKPSPEDVATNPLFPRRVLRGRASAWDVRWAVWHLPVRSDSFKVLEQVSRKDIIVEL